jgi:hypothetical protein
MIEWGTLLQPILVTLIQILLPVILGALALWLKELIAGARAKLSTEQLAFMESLASQLVLAAEQSGLTGAISDLGAEKKQWVIDQLQAVADAKHIKLDMDQLSALVEAAVVAAFGLSEPKPKG